MPVPREDCEYSGLMIRDVEEKGEGLMKDGRLAKVHEANASPYVVETDQYKASVQLMHQYDPGDPRGEPFAEHFAKPDVTQRWELQMQILLKEDLEANDLKISLETQAPTFGFLMRGVVRTVFAAVEGLNKLTAVGGAPVPWDWGFGEVGGAMAFVHVPIAHAYTFIETPPGETPPTLGTDIWNFEGIPPGRARNEVTFRRGYTYTINFWSGFMEWAKYGVFMPRLSAQRIDDFIGENPIFLGILGSRADGTQERYVNFEIIVEDVHTEKYNELKRPKDEPSRTHSEHMRDLGLAAKKQFHDNLFWYVWRVAVPLGALLTILISYMLVTTILRHPGAARAAWDDMLAASSTTDCYVVLVGLVAALLGFGARLYVMESGAMAAKDIENSSENGSPTSPRGHRKGEESEEEEEMALSERPSRHSRVARQQPQSTGCFSGCLAGFRSKAKKKERQE